MTIPRLDDLQDLGMPRNPDTVSILHNISTRSVSGGWGEDSNVTRYRSLFGCAAGSYGIIALAGLPKASFGASLGSTRIMSPVDDGRGKWEFVQAVPSLFSRRESEHWNIDQLSAENCV